MGGRKDIFKDASLLFPSSQGQEKAIPSARTDLHCLGDRQDTWSERDVDLPLYKRLPHFPKANHLQGCC